MRILPLAMLAAATLMATTAAAQEAPVLPSDGSPVRTSGSIKGYDSVTYHVEVEAGENVQVDFSPDNKKCYFNIKPDGSEELLYVSKKKSNKISRAVENPGRYAIKVFMDSNAGRKGQVCNYDLYFSAAAPN